MYYVGIIKAWFDKNIFQLNSSKTYFMNIAININILSLIKNY